MRRIDTIVIHCSATKPSQSIGVKEIRRWHKKRGWSDIGYHYVIRQDGTTEDGRPNQRVGAHAKGHNKHSLGICLVGGLDDLGNPSPEYSKGQRRSLRKLVDFLKETYHIKNANIVGHRQLPNVAKKCPCFNVNYWLKTGKMKA